jgi:hypothetical protein
VRQKRAHEGGRRALRARRRVCGRSRASLGFASLRAAPFGAAHPSCARQEIRRRVCGRSRASLGFASLRAAPFGAAC